MNLLDRNMACLWVSKEKHFASKDSELLVIMLPNTLNKKEEKLLVSKNGTDVSMMLMVLMSKRSRHSLLKMEESKIILS
jgi:hypothetical protein